MYTFRLILTTRPEYFSIQRYNLVCVKEISCLLPGATKISIYYCKKFLLQMVKTVKAKHVTMGFHWNKIFILTGKY